MKKKILTSAVLMAVASVGFVMSASAEERMSTDVAPVVVEGQQDVLPGGMAKSTQAVGILGSADVMDVPFTVNTVSEKTIQSFSNPYNGIAGALSLTPSVRIDRGGTYTDFSIRGKYESGHGVYTNGIPGLQMQGNITYDWIDSATVVSGPNIGVNGSSLNECVGGSINLQSKKGQKDQPIKVKIGYRGGSSMEESVAVGNRFGKDDRYGVHFTASNVHGKGVIDGEKLEQQSFHLNLDQASKVSKTNLLIGYDHTDHEGGTGAISFKAGSVTKMPSAPKGDKLYKPSWSYNEYDNWIMALNHEQKLGEHISAYVNAGYHREDWYGYIDGNPTVQNNKGDFSISMSNYPLDLTKKYVGIGVKGDFNIGTVKNEYTIGADRNWMSYALENNPGWSWKGTGNLFKNNKWSNPGIAHWKASHSYTQYMNGWHVVDTVKALNDKLQVTLGVHGHESKRNPSAKRNTGINAKTQESDAICPTFAISYKINPDLMVFADHSESFGMGTLVGPGKGYKNEGDVLDPAKTKQNEIGVKFKTGSVMNTVSAFQIKQANNVDKMINGNKYLVQDGEAESKGLEWAVTGQIGKKWDLIGGVMYLKAEQNEGQDVNGAAKWSANFGGIYRPDEAWALKGRINYLSSCTILDGALSVPARTIFDLGASYKTKFGKTPVTFDAMCYNVAGKDYWQARSGNNSLSTGAPRTFVFSATFDI